MANNNDEEFNTVFYIPQNFTDSGKALGGMFETRNLVEALIIAGSLGYLEIKFLTFSLFVKISIILITILPLAILALVGIDGNSLTQYLENVIIYLKNRRKLHYKRVGVKNVGKEKNNKKGNSKKGNGKQKKSNKNKKNKK